MVQLTLAAATEDTQQAESHAHQRPDYHAVGACVGRRAPALGRAGRCRFCLCTRGTYATGTAQLTRLILDQRRPVRRLYVLTLTHPVGRLRFTNGRQITID